MKFYGREKQKKQLHQLFQSDCQKIALIYGRRRIGKSELIRQCLRETKVKSIYYECKQTTEWNNTDSLSEIVSDVFGYPKLAFESIEQLLKFLFEQSQKGLTVFYRRLWISINMIPG